MRKFSLNAPNLDQTGLGCTKEEQMLRKTSLGSGEVLVGASPKIICDKPCYLAAVLIKATGADAVVIAYDNATAASGTIRFENTVLTANKYGGRNWTYPVLCNNGITISITGVGSSVIVEYIPLV